MSLERFVIKVFYSRRRFGEFNESSQTDYSDMLNQKM